MLHISQLTKYFGPEPILEEVSFVISKGERVGLVGPNGCGKSTLLQIIAGLKTADSGAVSLDAAATLGYLPQGSEAPPDRTVAEEVRSGIVGLDAARQKMEKLAVEMSQVARPAQEKILSDYGVAQTQFEALGGYEVEYRIPEILAGLGLDEVQPETLVAQLSGGQQARVGLARILIAEPNLLLLDEPTNHLDIRTLEWLENFLAAYSGAVLMVSHDRTFLDQTITRVLELNPLSHKIAEYSGNYSDYMAAKATAQDKQWSAWKQQQEDVRRIESDIRQTMGQAQHTENGTNNDSARRLAKKVAKKAKSREKRLQRYLDEEERVEKPPQSWQLKLEFGEMPRGGQNVVTLEGVSHAFADHYLFKKLNLSLIHGERIALLGPNGAGKTTLLRIIAGELSPAEGQVQIGANVRLGYMPQQQESLDPDATPLSLVRQLAPVSETDARNFLHFFLFSGDSVFVPIGNLSYGERARLLLAKMIIGGTNCLILDEPINHLDIPSRERFEEALEAFPGTILAAVHDRSFIDRFATAIWSVEDGTIRRYFDRQQVGRASRGT